MKRRLASFISGFESHGLFNLGQFGRESFAKFHYQNVETLKEALVKAWENLNEEKIRKTAVKVPTKLQDVIHFAGGHIEKKIFIKIVIFC